MPRQIRSPLAEFIGADEVLTTSQLVSRIVQRTHVKEDAARQRVSRQAQANDIWRSEKIILPGRARLFARRQFVGRPAFYDAVAKLLIDVRPGLARCLHDLGAFSILHEVQAQKLLATPADGKLTDSYPGLDRDIEALQEVGVAVHPVGTHRFLARHRPGSASSLSAEDTSTTLSLLRRESLLTRLLVMRFRKENLVSWSGSQVPSAEKMSSEFSGQVFSAYGFSFLRPLLRKPGKAGDRPKPCPVLIDVLGGECSKRHVESFLQRARRATVRRAAALPFLGVVAARTFADDAWTFARNEGLMAVNLLQMFGDQALEAMVIAERLLGGLSLESASADYTEMVKSLRRLKDNPVVVDLCSISFEAIAALSLRDSGYDDVALQRNVPFGSTTRDVDVHGRLKDDIAVIECKAYHAKKYVDTSELKKFYTETVPSFAKWWSVRNDNRAPSKVRAQFWTTGRFYADAVKYVGELSLKSNVVPELWDRGRIEAELSADIRKRTRELLSAIADTGDEGGELPATASKEVGSSGT
jgi:hypothetical protein